MKRFLLLLFACVGIAIFTAVTAQNSPGVSVITGQSGSTRDVTDLSCPSASNYSHLPDNLGAVGTASGIIAFDKIESTPFGPVTGITFWMAEAVVYEPLTVDIIFKHDAEGKPGITFSSYLSVALSANYTGETFSGYPVVEYTYDFPDHVSLIAGDWVGIADYPDNSFHHLWISSSDGDLSCYMYDLGYTQSYDLSFCLGVASEIPVSDWAICFVIFLILAFTAIRFRRAFV